MKVNKANQGLIAEFLYMEIQSLNLSWIFQRNVQDDIYLKHVLFVKFSMTPTLMKKLHW